MLISELLKSLWFISHRSVNFLFFNAVEFDNFVTNRMTDSPTFWWLIDWMNDWLLCLDKTIAIVCTRWARSSKIRVGVMHAAMLCTQEFEIWLAFSFSTTRTTKSISKLFYLDIWWSSYHHQKVYPYILVGSHKSTLAVTSLSWPCEVAKLHKSILYLIIHLLIGWNNILV